MDQQTLFRDPLGFLAEVEAVARTAVTPLLARWRALEPGDVVEKARNDLVSAADRAAEAAILDAIRTRFPEHSILSEEAGASSRGAERPLWIVDPLDGTTNFVHGLPQFAISVAVAVEGRVEAGVVLDPVRGDAFTACRGHGAWWNGARCRASTRAGLAGALLATGFPFRAHQLLEPYLAIFHDVFLRCKAIRRLGAAALDLAWTACGLVDGFFEFRLSPWDVAAGSLLIEEAGGVVTDMAGGAGWLDDGNLVCGPPGLHAELLEVIQSHRAAWENPST